MFCFPSWGIWWRQMDCAHREDCTTGQMPQNYDSGSSRGVGAQLPLPILREGEQLLLLSVNKSPPGKVLECYNPWEDKCMPCSVISLWNANAHLWKMWLVNLSLWKHPLNWVTSHFFSEILSHAEIWEYFPHTNLFVMMCSAAVQKGPAHSAWGTEESPQKLQCSKRKYQYTQF